MPMLRRIFLSSRRRLSRACNFFQLIALAHSISISIFCPTLPLRESIITCEALTAADNSDYYYSLKFTLRWRARSHTECLLFSKLSNYIKPRMVIDIYDLMCEAEAIFFFSLHLLTSHFL